MYMHVHVCVHTYGGIQADSLRFLTNFASHMWKNYQKYSIKYISKILFSISWKVDL